MFTWICPQCGREVPPSYGECPDCGAKEPGVQPGGMAPGAGTAATVPPVSPSGRRVASHLRLLMVLWMAQALLRILSMVPGLLLWFPMGMPSMALGPGSLFRGQFPPTGAGWAFLLVTSVWTVACLVVAWGLLDRARWARTYAIVVSVIWLLDFPLGTALSVYTLWVLLPETSEAEYRELAMQ